MTDHVNWKRIAIRLALHPDADFGRLSTRDVEALRAEVDAIRDREWIDADKRAEVTADAATFHEGH